MSASQESLSLQRAARDVGPSWLVMPGVVLIALAFLVPVVLLLSRSFTEAPGGLAHYEAFLSSVSLRKILMRTVWTAFLVTVISLAVGYPFAYLAASAAPKIRAILLGVVVASLFISLVVRCYGWLAILDRGGLLNAVLGALPFGNIQVIGVHNLWGVVVGLLQFTLPFMILPIYDVMRRVDARLGLAAASLGANPVHRFLRVYFPLTLPGVVAGCAIVFIVTLGYYIAPSILGGPQNMMIGELIAVKIRTTLEWGLGTAIASLLLLIAVVFFVVFYRATTRSYEVRSA